LALLELAVLAMHEQKPICSILHLSDLHLGADFADVGGKRRGFVRAMLDQKASVMQAHDDFLLLLLPLEISRISTINHARFRKAWPSHGIPEFFDRIVVSGDISTDGTSDERFAFAHSFLTAKLPLSRGVYGEQASIGLGLPNDALLCVPGNHDKMHEIAPSRFNKSFSRSPQQCNYVQMLKRFGRAFLFIGMDSNAYQEGNIANGEMDQSRLGWLSELLNQMQTTGLSQGQDFLSPTECAEAIKCLVIHHHVCDLSFKKRFFNPGRSFTRMNGAERLLKLISGKIQVILHGHEHYPTHFVDKESGALIVSAGTTSQWQGRPMRNSFYNLTFYDDKSLQIEEFVWNGKGFSSRERLRGSRHAPVYQLQ
jgi:3',5'-cyclic AMP phosphodiesterase CpdA